MTQGVQENVEGYKIHDQYLGPRKRNMRGGSVPLPLPSPAQGGRGVCPPPFPPLDLLCTQKIPWALNTFDLSGKKTSSFSNFVLVAVKKSDKNSL